MRAIRFGLDITSPGYNIYVSGLTGTGKTTVIKMFLDEIAATMPTPDDWCYVHNFRDPNSPLAFNLPAGRAKTFRAEMDELVRHLKAEIPKAFESKEYEQSMSAIVAENQEQQQTLFNELPEKARGQGFAIEVTKVGVTLVPLVDGQRRSRRSSTRRSTKRSEQEIERRRAGAAGGDQLVSAAGPRSQQGEPPRRSTSSTGASAFTWSGPGSRTSRSSTRDSPR